MSPIDVHVLASHMEDWTKIGDEALLSPERVVTWLSLESHHSQISDYNPENQKWSALLTGWATKTSEPPYSHFLKNSYKLTWYKHLLLLRDSLFEPLYIVANTEVNLIHNILSSPNHSAFENRSKLLIRGFGTEKMISWDQTQISSSKECIRRVLGAFTEYKDDQIIQS